MFFRFILLLSFSVLAMSCQFQSDVSVSPSMEDLNTLSSRVTDMDIQSPWDVMDLVVSISPETISFLYAHKDADLQALPVALRTKIEKLKAFTLTLKGRNLRILNPPQLPVETELLLAPEIEEIVNKEYERVNASREFFYEYLGGREKIKHYCVNECACIAQKYREALYEHKPMLLLVQGLGGIKVWSEKWNRKVDYDYHVATAIQLGPKQWGIIDPILFGDNRVRDLNYWYKNFDKNQSLSISLLL